MSNIEELAQKELMTYISGITRYDSKEGNGEQTGSVTQIGL